VGRAVDAPQCKEIAPSIWRPSARYGFMERPDIPALLAEAHANSCAINLVDVTYYLCRPRRSGCSYHDIGPLLTLETRHRD
jgi:K+ transporter